MSNVLDHEKRQQILGLGRLGWTVRRIAEATGVDRATAGVYLRAAGIPVRGRGRPGERAANPAITTEVSTDSGPSHAATSDGPSTAGMLNRVLRQRCCGLLGTYTQFRGAKPHGD
jgi:hypothetical protein